MGLLIYSASATPSATFNFVQQRQRQAFFAPLLLNRIYLAIVRAIHLRFPIWHLDSDGFAILIIVTPEISHPI